MPKQELLADLMYYQNLFPSSLLKQNSHSKTGKNADNANLKFGRSH